jgi:predicted transcriptional regulator
MNNTNIQSEKLSIIEWLLRLQDKTMIEKIKFLINNPKISKDWWETISEAEKKSIDRGLNDIEKGKLTPHAKVRKNYEKWL